jgi:hypothetical protein
MLKGVYKLIPKVFLLTLFLSGCRGDIDYMIEEYNSRFGIHDDRLINQIDASEMLAPQYILREDGSFGIPAPVGAVYEWRLLDYQSGTEKLIKSSTEQEFKAHVVDLGLAPETVYILKLKVTFQGKVYEDEADIYIKSKGTT